jgi:hypothetical protein
MRGVQISYLIEHPEYIPQLMRKPIAAATGSETAEKS